MSLEDRLKRLESRRDNRQPGHPTRRLAIDEIDFVLGTFPTDLDDTPVVLSSVDQRRRDRLLALCRSDLTEAEIDAELAKFACEN